ncbi:MFS transporter [Weissella bombi]|nr:MFS transporter [Weissella bombi]
MKAFKNESYLQSSVTMFLYFASWGIWWSFFQLWLTSKDGLNLNGSSVGTIYAANSLVTLILMFFYGTLQDKLGLKRNLLIFSGICAALVGPFFIYAYEPMLNSNFTFGLVVGSIFLSAGFLATTGIYEALVERFSRVFKFEYGQARAWGSFGYAVVALLAGHLFVINPDINFWLGSFFGVLLLLNVCFWVPKAEREEKKRSRNTTQASVPSVKEMLSLLKLRDLWAVIILIFFTWTFYTVFGQQMFPSFYAGLFGSVAQGQQMYGNLNSIQVFVEAIMMGLVPIIMNKIGVRNTLLLGITIMAIRIGLCGFIDNPIAISCVKMLHSFETPLFILSIFRYFTLHFETKLSATLYMIGFQVAAQLGQVVLSTPLGMLRDNSGYAMTFHIITIVVVAAGIYAFFVIKKDNQDVNGEPLINQAA